MQGGPAKHFARRKNIDIKCNYVMDMIKEGEMKLYEVDMADMITYYLTNPLPLKEFGAQL